jgi:CubicO group peptidase (beta-lactamase class C family)
MYGRISQHVFQATMWLLIIAFVAGCATSPLVGNLRVPNSAARQSEGQPASESVGSIDITMQTFDDTMRRELETYITEVMARTGIPGVAVGIIQNGEVVYQNGFGVSELGGSKPITPETLMMIGSTGKSMTSMMMATAVDDRLFSWDTPVVEVLPWFALSDPKLTAEVTMRQLLCNCTGVQRRDVEIFFTSDDLTAEGVVQSLRTFPVEGTFGETFGYINQMVSAGGYATAAAAGSSGDLYSDYVMQMQARIFDPIGMSSTTFSFEQVQARSYAIPHSITADMTYIPITLEVEQMLTPNAPAGGSWSNIEDLMRYLSTQLNRGVAPDGTRVVSAENLTKTWQSGVQASPTSGYGLGWGFSDYYGERLLVHGGGTAGFSSILAFLPEANLAIAVISNAGLSNAATRLPTAITFRLFELVFGQPMTFDARFVAAIEADKQMRVETIQQLQPTLDKATVESYVGVYTNNGLGKITLSVEDNKFILDVGEFASELRPIGEETYVFWDPPLATARVELTWDYGDQPIVIFDPHNPDAPMLYTFTKVQ